NEQIEAWRSSLPRREDLAEAIERFAANADLAGLGPRERWYVERWRKDVRLAGGGRSPAVRAEMARLTERLLEVASAFLLNLAKPPRITVDRSVLEGLPDAVRSAAIPVEREREDDADRVELPIDGGTYLTIMEQSPSRELRERAYRAWCSKGVPENLPLLRETFELRHRLARLAGYPSWQAYRVEDLAAPDTAFVNGFIEDLATRLRPIAERERAEMEAVLRAQPDTPADFVLQDWDWRHGDAIQRAAVAGEGSRIAEYFDFEPVLDGLAALSADVYEIRLEARPERTAWDPDVRAFDLIDVPTGRVIEHLFLDPWTRPGKQSGGWTDFLLPGGGRHGEEAAPTVSLCVNVSKPAEGPALLSPLEVDTLFHEYGHVLNHAVGHGPFVLHRQSWLAFDVIEGPSEFNGRWSLQPEVVARYARHHRTGDPIPPELVEAIRRSESLNVVSRLFQLLAQVRFDALVHGETEVPIEEADRIAWSIRAMPEVEGIFFPAGITHLVGGTYDAALYGYAWSDVIRDDLLERFEAGGLLSPEMGARYRETILAANWTDDPMGPINAFLGRPWSIDAFLRRAAS
ncbi:MAG TPA: M3 family metallopeptidase, partial [Candidatus Limnocylindrales bacterium]|nr:M3 family metallopeptidase [Candidatus Limnocylindrales bacterium]